MEETTNAKWKQLQAMRQEHGDTPPAPAESSPTEVIASTPDQPRDDAGKFAKAETAPAEPTPTPPAVESAPPVAAAPAPADVTPRSEEIEIDGQKINVDPSLAAAFKKAADIQKSTAKANEFEEFKAQLRAELKAEFTPPPKTEAELAAEVALKAAEIAAKLPKKPDSNLLITDPNEYDKQRDLYEEARIKSAADTAKADALAEFERRTNATAQKAQVDAEANARAILREQFYQTYGVLKPSSEFVDTLLATKFDEVVKSGKLAKPLTPAEQEALKQETFADVAARATRKVVELMNAGKKIAPPPPPPTLAASAPAVAAKKPAPAPETRGEKYPKGSVSALLAARKASRDTATA